MINHECKNINHPCVFVSTNTKLQKKYSGEWVDLGINVDLTTFESYEEFVSFCKEYHNDEEKPELRFLEFDFIPSNIYNLYLTEKSFPKDAFDAILKVYNHPQRKALYAYFSHFYELDVDLFQERYIGTFATLMDMAKYVKKLRGDKGRCDMQYAEDLIEIDGYIYDAPFAFKK